MTDGSQVPPADIKDQLAYFAGYIEGQALRQQRGAFQVVDEPPRTASE